MASSTVPANANAHSRSHPFHPKPSLLKSKLPSNSKPWRKCDPSILPICCTNSESLTAGTTEGTESQSLAEQLKPLAQEFLGSKSSANNTHPLSLSHGSSISKSIWVNPTKPGSSVLSTERHRRPKSHTWTPRIAELRVFAQKLNSCEPTQEAIFEALDSLDETPTPKDAMVILNNLQSWEKAYTFFQWLKRNEDFEMGVLIYNVTMKALRRGKQWDLVEELLLEMLAQGIQPDNITYSTAISCARRCNLPHKAVEWFQRMNESGCVPDEVTYTAMIDAYGRAGKVQEALNLYERARAGGWRPDAVTFSTLLNMYGIAEDYDGAYNTFMEMKALGVKPNLITYNTMLDALGKAGRPSMAKGLFKEMIDVGLTPNQVTLTSLLRIYGRARWTDDALKLWERMRKEGWSTDLILYNTLLSMCADIGSLEEAERLFKEMNESENCKPDSWSYTSMINIFSSVGRVEEASKMFNEMIEAGFKPNVMVFTCLVQCYGKAKRFDDVVRVFDLLLDEGIFPDDKFCGCLLSVLTLCEGGEFGKILGCLEKVNPKLGLVVKMLQEEETAAAVLREELRTVLNQATNQVRKPFCNCLIDICCNLNFPERAHELLNLATMFGVYTSLQTRSPREWCLNLRSLSFGSALTAFQGWISSLSKALEDGEELPPLLGIQTGHGNHKLSSDHGLAGLFESHLRGMGSPFQESAERVGWFFATREAATPWLQSMNLSTFSTAKNGVCY